MRLMIAIFAAGLAVPAHAEIVECVPNSFGWWTSGEVSTSTIAGDDDSARVFTLDLETGDFDQPAANGNPAVAGRYDIIEGGEIGDDATLVAFSRDLASLVRVRLTNTELQFLRDDREGIEGGTCSIIRSEPGISP